MYLDNFEEIVGRRGYTPEFIQTARRNARLRQMDDQARMMMWRNGMPEWVREIVRDTARRRDVHALDIMDRVRTANVVAARNEAMYLVKDRKPMLSSPMIGKWFGRDHTSALHSIASHAERNGLRKLVGYDLDALRRRNAAISQAKRDAQKAENRRAATNP